MNGFYEVSNRLWHTPNGARKNKVTILAHIRRPNGNVWMRMVPANNVQVGAFDARNMLRVLHCVDQVFRHDFHSVLFDFSAGRNRHGGNGYGDSAAIVYDFLQKHNGVTRSVNENHQRDKREDRALTWPMSRAATSSFSVSRAKLWHINNTSSDTYTSVT